MKDPLLSGKEVQKHPAWLGDLPGGKKVERRPGPGLPSDGTGILHCCIAEPWARFQDILIEIVCFYSLATERIERIKCTLSEKVKHGAHQLAILKHTPKRSGDHRERGDTAAVVPGS